MITITRVFLLTITCASGAWAQSVAASGAVAGFSLESPGNGLPDTTVTLTNTALGVRRLAATSVEGAFDILALPPGAGYKLKLVRKDYADWESSEFEVPVGQSLVFQIQMQKERPVTNVDIETVTSRVESNQTGVTIWIDPLRTSALPASGRLLDPLIVLAPAVTLQTNTGRIAFHGEASSNSFLNDGIVTTSGYFGERPGIAGVLTQDSTQELRVLSATYPAEFGRAMGGVVDAVTSTGANDFHGTAFDYVRNRNFDASSRFAAGQSLLGHRSQTGANFSGPIRPDQLFFFADLESLTDHFQAVNQITTRTLADSTGTVIPASNCTATAAQCAAAIKFIQSQMNVVEPFSEHWTGGLARMDYRRSEVNAVNLEINARNARSPEEARRQLIAPNGGLLGLSNSSEDTRYLKIGWTASPESAVNELRLGLVENRYFEPASQSTLSTGNVALTVAGATVGSVHPNSTSVNEHRYQLVDNVTITSGAHTLRLGADVSKTRDYLDTLSSAGAYTYPTLTAFALDFSGTGTSRSYTTFTQQFGTTARRVPYREIAFYGQDTWRAFTRVDLTFGVRWEKTSLPGVPVTNPTYYQTASIPSSNMAISPRLSLAYMVNDNTVLRAGFGYFYAPYQGQAIDALLNGNGISQTSISVNSTQAVSPFFPRVMKYQTTGISNLMYPVAKLRNPHTQQATLALEKRVGRATTITVSGISSHAVKLWTGTDVNLGTPTRALTYPIYTATGSVAGSYSTNMWTSKNDSNYAHIYSVGNGGSGWYNAGGVEWRQRMAQGMSLQASYTWSHAIGTNTGPMLNGVFPLTSTPVDFTTDRGNLPTDQRHRAVFNWTWQPKIARGDSWVARYLVNGWQLSGIVTLASGLSETPTVLVAGNQNSSFTMGYFNSLNGSGGWARATFQPVGSLSTDPQRNLDARIERSIRFTERVKGLLAFEAFNALNTQRITGVNSIAYTAVTNQPNAPYTGLLRPVAGVGSGNSSNSFPDGTSARRAQMSFRVVF